MKRIILIFCVIFLFSFVSYAETTETSLASTSDISPETNSIKSNTILIIIPQYNFPDDEYTIPKVILSRAGFTIEVASASTKEIAIGTDIIKVRPNLTVEQINVDKYDAVILVGGYMSKKFYENPVLISKVTEFVQKGKLIGAMDNMPYYLAKWGLIRGAKVTVNPSLAKDLKKMGMNYVEKDIVIDKNFITVDMYKYSDAFAGEFLEELKKR